MTIRSCVTSPTFQPSEEHEEINRNDRRNFLKVAVRTIVGTAAIPLLHAQPQDPAVPSTEMFKGFKSERIQTTGATINVVWGGQGPPLLLLHGNPETHVMWHKIAPRLAEEFTVLAADLRGYGDSSKPEGGENHSNYSKRAMALDQVELMGHFGFEKFAVAGHDRGGRVGHRMALDYPQQITKLAVLDIVPTYDLLHRVTNEVATAFYHWFFLIQPSPFPETMIASNVEFYLKYMMFRNMAHNEVPAWMGHEAFAEYLRCYRDSATLHATCEDYRAGESIDMEHDEKDLKRKITCPVLALWGKQGAVQRYFDVLSVWRERAVTVSGKPIAGRHFLPEESPNEVHSELRAFLKP
jgi:haloacetate dehalogenase